jgi:hypothetical protein
MIGVTGATGRLGREIMRLIESEPIGHRVPAERFDAIIHCASPRADNQIGLLKFDGFNLALRQYMNHYQPRLVVIGSCWQILKGSSHRTAYAEMKRKQTDLFPEATHVIPYWIYGMGRGFIYQLTEVINGRATMASAGIALRDFVHVTDVARDAITAIGMEPGMFASCTSKPVSPIDVADHFGIRLEKREPEPSTILAYPLPQISEPKVELIEWIASQRRY